MITPTVGRVVWYYRGTVGPLAALVAHVHEDNKTVNLGYLSPHGLHGCVSNVPLVQDGETIPDGDYCCWMPFQIGQAAKTESVTSALEARVADLERALARMQV